MKKKHLLPLLLLLLTTTVMSQNWESNFKKATDIAQKNDKRIILVFQGSDWCAPCIKLDKEIWSTQQFQSLAKNKFVMVKADFPRKKQNRLSDEQQKQNNTLAEKYNPKGYFPYIVILDANGKFLGSSGYKKTTPQEYFKILNAFN